MVVGYISEYPHAASYPALRAPPQPAAAAAAGDTAGPAPQQQQEQPQLPPSAELFWGGRTVELPGGRVAYGSVWPRERADTLRCKGELFRLYDEGELDVWVDGGGAAFSGLERVADAVDYMLTGQALGKVVVSL